MQRMKTNYLLAAGLALVFFVGCGRNTGYVIKPVSLDERLTETTILADRGLFVSDTIAIIDVQGLLMNQERPSLMGKEDNPVSLFIEKLDKAQDDPNLKAVVLRVNSPGGGVTASDIMYHRLMQFRRAKNVPVVVMIEDVGASGAYYIACGGDTIMAHPTAVTGSIGVIVEQFSFYGAMTKLGITAKAVKSGDLKDMGSPFKPLDERDSQVIQTLVTDMYNRFVDVVAKGRPRLAKEKVLQLADGRVYSGDQALANGLVDQLGYMNDAIAVAKARCGAARVKVVMYHRPLGYVANAYSAAGGVQPQMNLINITAPDLLDMTRPQFLYLWTGK